MTGKTSIIYIHGFNSSPDSEKAQNFSQYCLDNPRLNIQCFVPELSFDPRKAIVQLEELVNKTVDNSEEQCFLVGSSLGGFYATYLAEKYHCKAALINPAVSSKKSWAEQFIGEHTNYYTNHQYQLTHDHVDFCYSLDVPKLRFPELFLVLLQTGDEVLDYRLAVTRYEKSEQVVEEGGSHGFDGFKEKIPKIMNFFGLLK